MKVQGLFGNISGYALTAFLLLTPLAVLAHEGEDEVPPVVKEAVSSDGPGVAIMATTCTTCHGENGISPGSIPSLAGRQQQELAGILKSFKAGMRPSTIMGRIIRPFSDTDIEALARYFSLRKAPLPLELQAPLQTKADSGASTPDDNTGGSP